MAAMSDARAPGRSSEPPPIAGERYQDLLRERDDLNRRLNDALSRLASADAGAFSLAAPGGTPQHDRLVQVFRQLKLQDFQALSSSLYSLWSMKPGTSATRATYALAVCRQMFAEEVLIEGQKLLGIRTTTNSGNDLDEVRQTIYQAIRTRFKMKNNPPPELADKLTQIVCRSLDLLRSMALASPPARLLVPRQQAAFTLELHEAMTGCPDQSPATVQLTVFPGYLVTESNRLLEKALVYTATGG